MVIWIRRTSDEGDGIAKWAGVIAKIDGAGGKAIRSAGLEETEGGGRDAAADAVIKGAVQIDLGGEVRAVVLRRYPGKFGIVRPDFVDADDWGGRGRSGVPGEANAVNGDLGRGLAAGILGVDAKGVGVPRKKGCKGVASGGPGKNDGGADIVSAPEVIVEVAGVSGSRVLGEGDCVSGRRRHAKVLRRRWRPCGGGRRSEDHHKDRGHYGKIENKPSGFVAFSEFFNVEHK